MTQPHRLSMSATTLLLCCALGAGASATTVPFTEDFASGHANWLNFNGSAPLTHHATGGPDGRAYVSGTFNFQAQEEDDTAVIIRGTSSVLGAASDGAFFGNWINEVTTFRAQVRHNANFPLNFFTRFASPFNFPGGFALHFVPVLPNTWTEVEVAVTPTNRQFVTFEGQTFNDVFDDVGIVQFGVSVPAALAAVNQDFTFDIAQVSIVPEPSCAALAVLALVGLTLRRRRS